ncbi:MAG: hypothetical protein LUH82_07990 [Clostridiales bacterium]|nr:hypothetical protein [Clostridiales bacterium]
MLKKIKKLAALVTAAVLVAAVFSGCSSKPGAEMTEENITATVDTVFEALVNFDVDDLGTYVDSSTLNTVMSYAEKYEQFQELGKAIFASLEYEIEEINIDEATVTLTVYNKDLYDIALEFVDDLLDKYSLLQLLTKLSSESWLDDNLSDLTQKIDDAVMNVAGTEITLDIEQKSDNLVLSFDTEAEDGVSGGALGAIKQIYS